MQLAALLLAALRVPLAARYPAAGERLAIYLVLATQVCGSAILFPLILRDPTTAAFAIGSCWPVIAAAGTLSALRPTTTVRCATYATLWMAGLALWQPALRAPRRQLIASAAAAFIAFGGPLVGYLGAEFNPAGGGSDLARYAPIPVAFRVAGGSGTSPADWVVPAVLLGSAGIALLLRAWRRPHRTEPAANEPRPSASGQLPPGN